MYFFVNGLLYIETPRPNTIRHVHAHKCLHCAGIEPANIELQVYIVTYT
jgi:hypothetical protein